MNIYKCLSKMGYKPEDCIGQRVVTMYREAGRGNNYALGLYGELLAYQKPDVVYDPYYKVALCAEMLELTPVKALELFLVIHDRAGNRGIDVRSRVEEHARKQESETKSPKTDRGATGAVIWDYIDRNDPIIFRTHDPADWPTLWSDSNNGRRGG